MSLNTNQVNIVSAALLFMAEKYRQIILRADLFSDGGISDEASRVERAAMRLAATVASTGIATPEQGAMTLTALEAFADDANRKAQLMNTRGQPHESAHYESRVRAVYATMAAVEAGDGAGVPTPDDAPAAAPVLN
jgi:hypothetical protein